MYIHCLAHCNELVFKDATSNSSLLSDSQILCEDLYALVGVSPKRELLFESIQADCEVQSKHLRLQNLSFTRWTERGGAAFVLLNKTNELREVLLRLSKDISVTPQCRSKVKCLLKKMKSENQLFSYSSCTTWQCYWRKIRSCCKALP